MSGHPRDEVLASGSPALRNDQWEYVSGHWVDRDDWDHYSAALDWWTSFQSVKRAVAATRMSSERPQTKRQRRERLQRLRLRLRELTSELRDARAAVKNAERHYEAELRWLEEFGGI